jgi:hypothetical protein
MEAATVPQVQKRLYRNNTAGWLGVVKLDHKGEEKGDNVEPFGEVWLSDDEAVLTARAPRRPEDNPFEEQVFVKVNPETGTREEYKMRPLTLVSTDARYVPTNERYVPTQDGSEDAAPPVARTQATTSVEAPSPASTGALPTEAPPAAAPAPAAPVPAPRTQPVSGPPPAPVTSASGQRVDGVTHEEGAAERESWIVEPEAPGRVIAGQLGGDDNGTGADAAGEPTDAPPAADRYVPPVTQGAAPQQPGGVPEEHAEAVDPRIGEETGAARPPAAPAPQGEYASHEEVGSPAAPAAADDEPVEGLIGG